MRRAVVAVIMGGFTLGGIGPGLGHQPAIFGVSLTAGVPPAINNASLTAVIRPVKKTVRKTVNKTARKTVRRTPEKTIEYEGVEFRVPAGWPVYWLDKDPNQCVRYDRNAVYVGTPGPNQNCPPGLIGRADTISIGDPSASARQNASRTPLDRPAPARVDQRADLGLAAVHFRRLDDLSPGILEVPHDAVQARLAGKDRRLRLLVRVAAIVLRRLVRGFFLA